MNTSEDELQDVSLQYQDGAVAEIAAGGEAEVQGAQQGMHAEESDTSQGADLETLQFYVDKDKCCCVCFHEQTVVSRKGKGGDASLADLEPFFFEEGYIPDNIMVLSCCGKHYICISCLRNIVNNYENHPINENNSHIFCPYPFDQCSTDFGFRTIFDHGHIKKICRSEYEWTNYERFTEQYAFPGYTRYKCPSTYYEPNTRVSTICNTDILIENEAIRNSPIGELIVECSQNPLCLRRFCFNCKCTISYYSSMCHDCKTQHENENPNVYNYFFNKGASSHVEKAYYCDEREVEGLSFEEDCYLFLNKDITVDVALSQIKSLIEDVNSYMICPICKISIYKTEKCNGLSHHNLERCYACGRIGFKIKGLGDHWECRGVAGCYRFDTESFVRQFAPSYLCNETLCSNHDKGDCSVPEHQEGIAHLDKLRKKAYVYHALISLMPAVQFQVYDQLFEQLQNTPTALEYLPFKQTLVILSVHKNRNRDYIEDVVYTELNCELPQNVDEFKMCKSHTISARDYISMHKLPDYLWRRPSDTDRSVSSMAAIWRSILRDPALNPFFQHRQIQQAYDEETHADETRAGQTGQDLADVEETRFLLENSGTSQESEEGTPPAIVVNDDGYSLLAENDTETDT